jgi:hypothetical protein
VRQPVAPQLAARSHDEASVRSARHDEASGDVVARRRRVLFVISAAFESRYPWLGYIRATMEAAMVGGLADWFAVTALFRHPLGIPIPHTAIVPSQKDASVARSARSCSAIS